MERQASSPSNHESEEEEQYASGLEPPELRNRRKRAQPMMLAVSAVYWHLPLLGIVSTIARPAPSSDAVDGLFMSLRILLSLSGLFFWNAFWECRRLWV